MDPDGIMYVPYVAERSTLMEHKNHFYDPLEDLRILGSDVPYDDQWCVDHTLIADYMSRALSYLTRNGIEVRKVDGTLDGGSELLVSYKISEDDLEPVCPNKQSQGKLCLGALYRFRDYSRRAEWPFGENECLPGLFTGKSVSPKNMFAIIMQRSQKQMY